MGTAADTSPDSAASGFEAAAPQSSPAGNVPAAAATRDEIAATAEENRRLAAKCRDLSDRIDALMNVHHAAILIIDPATGMVIDGNHAAVRRYAADRDALLRMHIRSINTLPPDEIARRMRQAVSTECDHFEFRHRLADGSLQDVDVYSGPIVYNGETALISFIHDATRRKALEHKLKTMATTDSLTGCANRGHFLELLHWEFLRSRRSGTPLSFAMLDVDRFKAVNDTHGHLVGDAVLKAISDACRATIRESDCLGRLGGEEFGILLPETSPEEAPVVLARVLSAAANATVEIPRAVVAATVSIGHTALAPHDRNETPLLTRADAALYAAKANGRNRVECLFA